ncbi:MAG: hypothetical protein IT204_06465 [Fimbriimonadaceae bacterium]|nr:hypothetical protein [Fimbriimonadaceae bacterium]
MRPALLVVFCLTPLSAAEWSDGSSIAPFAKQAGAELRPVADFTGLSDRHWAVPTLWANRLQDWHVVNDSNGGWYEAAPSEPAPCRTVHLTTWELSDAPLPFRLEAVFRTAGTPSGFLGFLVGAGEGRLDHRGAALVQHMPGQGGGLLAVIEATGEGGLQFRDMSRPETTLAFPPLAGQQTLAKAPLRFEFHQLLLQLEGVPRDGGATYDLRLAVWSRHQQELLGAQELRAVPAARLRGNVALVAHAEGPAALATKHRVGFVRVGAGRLTEHPERGFGPCAGTLFTQVGGTLRLSAQFMHLGQATLPKKSAELLQRMSASLEARPLGTADAWRTIAGPLAISPPDYYVPFVVPGWDARRDWETQVRFTDERGEVSTYRTVVPREPLDQPRLSVAGFTGMGAMGRTVNAGGPPTVAPGEVILGRWTPANVWHPFDAAVRQAQRQQLDLLFFTGDQIYEGKPTPRENSREPSKDYLYKWLLWHWAFRDLTNHVPALCQPDDHDVWQGNLWGWGGRLNLSGANGDGGYFCSPYWVNMVHRTQTGHHPPAWDRTPGPQGITHYYGGFAYGGVGFAVLEDRAFKTPGRVTDPAEQELLGDEQLRFLRTWGGDWTNQVLKCAVSQTIYACAHTNFDGQLGRDFDTGGWPKAERDQAVDAFRRAGMFVLGGDQHLATFTHLGIDRVGDAVYNFAVPALGNIFWRWFYPAQPGANRAAGAADWLGEFVDAFGSPFQMVAVANPERQDLLRQKLRARAVLPKAEAEALGGTIVDSSGVEVAVGTPRVCLGDGYGVLRFDKRARTVTVECWPHDADPTAGGKCYPGWPVTLPQSALDGRRPLAWLPDITVSGLRDPVVKVLAEPSGELLSATRLNGTTWRPGVYSTSGSYTVVIGWPEAPAVWKALKGLRPSARPGASRATVKF